MIGNFEVELQGAKFEFKTMNANRLQLFQVYVDFEGKKMRFHMQRKGEGDFCITDKDKVPAPYLPLEAQLNAAVLAYGDDVSR